MADTNSVYLGTGRRKTAVARIRLTEGTGKVLINGKSKEDFFSHENFSRAALLPFTTIEAKDKFDLNASVHGGGDSGQAGALAHGIARGCQALQFVPRRGHGRLQRALFFIALGLLLPMMNLSSMIR